MKKRYLGLFLAFFAMSIHSCKKQTEKMDNESATQSTANVRAQLTSSMYYWYNGSKIPLVIDSTAGIVLTDDYENVTSSLKSVSQPTKLRSDYYLFESKARLDLSKVTGKIKNLQYGYKTLSNEQLTPTGEIVVQPKQGVEFGAILSKSSAKLSIKSRNKYGTYVLKVESNNSILDVANEIYKSGLVDSSHPNFIARIIKYSNDPLFSSQYYLSNTGQTGGTSGIDISVANWSVSDGFYCGIKVAVIDDGVETHEELTGRVLPGYTPNTPGGLGSPGGSDAHGEACAGIVAAAKDNSLGISGVAPKALVIPINIFQGVLSTADVAGAIDWAWDEGGADVLSNSWGYNSSSGTDDIVNAITRARTLGRGGKGATVVFASGNGGGAVAFPANVNGVVAVGAINKFGAIWGYSNRGPELDLVAPSGDIGGAGDVVTTDRTGGFGYVSGNYYYNFGGTSAACPQVAGAAALILSLNPNFTESQIVSYLRSTATDMGAIGFDNTFGYGRLKVSAAMAAAKNDIYSIVPQWEYFGRLCVNIPESIQYYSINVPPGATVSWTGFRVNIVGSTTSSTVAINGNPAYTQGTGRITATITIPGCGTISSSLTMNLKNDCI